MQVLLVFWLIGGAIFGFAGGTIRANQGGSFGGGFAWGFFLGIIGLIVVIATKPKPRSAPARPPQPPVSDEYRECPHCKEGMRRDASVCPHCQRDSAPWRFWEGRWWTPAETEPPQWYDEQTARWRPFSEIPAPGADRFDVVVTGVSDAGNIAAIARTIADVTGEPVPEAAGRLANLPATVVVDASYSTAEGVRSAASRKGASVELRPYVTEPTLPPALAGDERPA